MPLVRTALLFCILGLAATLRADEPSTLTLSFIDADKTERTLTGQKLVEAQDGGILLLARDGRLWNITPDQILKQHPTDAPFKPLSHDEMGKKLIDELGPAFQYITTKHYVIATDAGPEYARWCGRLFERLLLGFLNQWRATDLKLHEPNLPLAAIVFADQAEFAAYATKNAGPQYAAAKGFYSIPTNRMVLYDLSRQPGSPDVTTEADIIRRVSRSPFNVATVVHEATHQIAFNSGMHRRFASNPVWLTEGMAMYFETPDLRSRAGWRTIGKVNPLRIKQFQSSIANRSPDSIKSLIADDKRFTDPAEAAAAYADAWALSYFLIRSRRADYGKYLEHLQQKPYLIFDSPEQRIAEFEAYFGEDWEGLEKAFLRYMRGR